MDTPTGSATATGAVLGSVIPGVGTLLGAGAGLIVDLFSVGLAYKAKSDEERKSKTRMILMVSSMHKKRQKLTNGMPKQRPIQKT